MKFVTGIRMDARRGVAYLFISALLFNICFMSACTTNSDPQSNQSGEVIPDDTPWYEYEKIDLSSSYRDQADYSDLFMEYIGKIDDINFIKVSGCTAEYQVLDVAAYNSEWELVNTINLLSLYEGEYDYLEDIYVRPNYLEAKIVTYDEQTWEETPFIIQFNPVTGEIGDRKNC